MDDIDAWWLDGSEPELLSTDDRFITEILTKSMGSNSLGTFSRYLNTYSLMTTKGIFHFYNFRCLWKLKEKIW